MVQPAVRGGPEQHRVDRPVADGVVVATLTTWFVVVDGGGAAPGGRFSRWSGLGRCSILEDSYPGALWPGRVLERWSGDDTPR